MAGDRPTPDSDSRPSLRLPRSFVVDAVVELTCRPLDVLQRNNSAVDHWVSLPW